MAASSCPAYSSGSDCLQARQATAPPGDGIRHGAAFMPGGGCALPGLLVRLRLSVGPASNGAAGRRHQARSCVFTRMGARPGKHGAAGLRAGLCRLRHPALPPPSVGPASNCAAGRWHQARSCVYAGWRLRLTRPTFKSPAGAGAAETAGAGGLNIAETFPEGRGSPHGWLRACFAGTLPRPDRSLQG